MKKSEEIHEPTRQQQDEYLIGLQHRNRAQRMHKIKDPKLVELEQREKGFSLYINGANAQLPNTKGSQRASHRPTDTDDTVRTKEDTCGVTDYIPSSHPTLQRTHRRKWVQESVEIRTESGSRVKISLEDKNSNNSESSNGIDLEDESRGDGAKQKSANEELNEYLINLKHMNRAQRTLKVKDPKQMELEQREEGFSLYINGANANLAKAKGGQRGIRRPTHTSDAARSREDMCAVTYPIFSSHAVPERTQRRQWVQQESVEIRTESGSRVKISAADKNSNNFESYNRVDKKGENEYKMLGVKCHSISRSADNLLLDLDKPKVLQPSLESSVKHSYCDSVGDKSDNNLMEEQIEKEGSDVTLPLSSRSQSSSSDLIVLNSGPSPTGSGDQVQHPLSALNDIPAQQDSGESVLSVSKALQRENAPLHNLTYKQHQTLSPGYQDHHQQRSLHRAVNNSITHHANINTHIQEEEEGIQDQIMRSIQRIILRGPSQQRSLLKALESIETEAQSKVSPAHNNTSNSPPNEQAVGRCNVRVYVNSTLVFDGQSEKVNSDQVFDYSTTINLQEHHLTESTSPISACYSPHDSGDLAQDSIPEKSETSSLFMKEKSDRIQKDVADTPANCNDSNNIQTVPSEPLADPHMVEKNEEVVTTVTTQPAAHRVPEHPSRLELQNNRDSKPQHIVKQKLSVMDDVSCSPGSVCGQQVTSLTNTVERNNKSKPECKSDLFSSPSKKLSSIRAVNSCNGSTYLQIKSACDDANKSEEIGSVGDDNHCLRSHWRRGDSKKPITDFFLRHCSHPSAVTSNPVTPDCKKKFEIPFFPQGQYLLIRILSTWGDSHYVGLRGVAIFSATGEPITPHCITAVVKGIPEVNGTIYKLMDGIQHLQDDSHMWLAPFVPGKRCEIVLDLGVTQCLSMIQVWNYNKSHIHSFRGVRDVDMLLDGQRIFIGEIAKASGSLMGGHDDCFQVVFGHSRKGMRRKVRRGKS